MSEALDTTVRYTGKHTAVIVVSGDVDLHTAPLLRVEALTAMTRGARHLVLDMAEVDFVDSTGLSTLIVVLHATQEPGGSLRVARVPERLVRMVTMTGIAELLPVHDTVADALAALGVDDDAAHEGADGAADPGGGASADRRADTSATARADLDTDVSASVSGVPEPDASVSGVQDTYASATARADLDTDVSATVSGDQDTHASATLSGDQDTDASVTVCAGRNAQASTTVCADRGADVSVTASADPGADVTASADRGVDDAVGGAGPSR
ncbi:STAS domain-containing protein [Streptomyces lusitanus]|uniref:STAS domain-containing protein n=1 Tax=Streptomyces lusitanus TaxID=68232 RepID=UPI0021BEA487|nr:STAS domain-containing protein [Streptomyces lusitanus]